MPFGAMKSRHGVAVMLSFLGSKIKVYELMRTMSHRTRAYIHNANGLKGFLTRGTVLNILEDLQGNKKELLKMTDYQLIDIPELLNEYKAVKYMT